MTYISILSLKKEFKKSCMLFHRLHFFSLLNMQNKTYSKNQRYHTTFYHHKIFVLLHKLNYLVDEKRKISVI